MTGEITYEMTVPSDPSVKTHDSSYLENVNSSGGWRVLLDAINDKNKKWLKIDEYLLARNKSPHGLGGLLIFDFRVKNIFEMSPERQAIFYSYLTEIEFCLRKEYGGKYYILIGMCLSKKPGVGKRQSIAYAHAHISLIPRIGQVNQKEYHSGVTIEPVESIKISGATYKIKGKTNKVLTGFGAKTEHTTGVVIYSHNKSPYIQLPSTENITKSDIGNFLGAQDATGNDVGSTVSALVTDEYRTRVAFSLGTPGYLHFDGISLNRQTTDEQCLDDFNNFGEEIFRKVCKYVEGNK